MGALSHSSFSRTSSPARRSAVLRRQSADTGEIVIHTIESPREGLTPVLVTGTSKSLHGVSGKTSKAFIAAVHERLGSKAVVRLVPVDSLGAARQTIG